MSATPKVMPKRAKNDKPWSKGYSHKKAPEIRGSRLLFTTSSSRSMRAPEPVEPKRYFA